VFWDEFDSAKDGVALFWLKMFLAPMQDGEFTQDRSTTHRPRDIRFCGRYGELD